MGKHQPHRRGGSYELYKSHQVTNWSYDPMDKKCLDKLKIGDRVRVCFLEKDDGFYKRYVRITKQLSRTHFMGIVDDNYACGFFCAVCKNILTGCNIYCYDGDLYNRYDIYVHDECLSKCVEYDKPFRKAYLRQGNGSKLVFSKSNIIEIPNWTRNTRRLFEEYGQYEDKNVFSACVGSEPQRRYKY